MPVGGGMNPIKAGKVISLAIFGLALHHSCHGRVNIAKVAPCPPPPRADSSQIGKIFIVITAEMLGRNLVEGISIHQSG